MTSPVALTAYRLRADVDWPIRPAPAQRAWMDAFTQRWPYRCLPLVMANQSGWEILCPVSFEAEWNGKPGPDGLRVTFAEREDLWSFMIRSHFGGGILTFNVPYLFRTEAPVGLSVRGACNFWIEGATPLDGWVETWGLEAPFSMNWKVLAVDTPVRFRAGDPICLIQPFDPALLESARPVLRDLADAPDLAARMERWRQERIPIERGEGGEASSRAYTRGLDAAGAPYAEHRRGLTVPPFGPPEPRPDDPTDAR